jgi:hypothetical protein
MSFENVTQRPKKGNKIMRNKSADRAPLGFLVVAALLFSLGANTTIAGEITGNGKWIAGSPDAPLNGKSECAYSGREDAPDSGDFKGSIAQSWGQLPKAVRDFLTSIKMNPGNACNPTKSGG